MAAKDNLGGQFGASNPQQIPAHHRDAILKAINIMGERGMELVPGGMHVTPSDGGKSHFIPHIDTELYIKASQPDEFSLHSRAPSEGQYVVTSVVGNRYHGPYVRTGVGPHPSTGIGPRDEDPTDSRTLSRHATSMREEHDDPAHLLDRKHDSVLPDSRNAQVFSIGESPRGYGQPHGSTTALDTGETLNMLPHLGGNPKAPAQDFTINLGNRAGILSEDIDAIKGLHRAYSHVYDEEERPRTSVGPTAFRRGPFSTRDRHVFPVFVNDNENSTAYMYNTVNGQITKH